MITDAGNVGIGTLAPGGKLHVVSSGDIDAPQALLTQTTSGDFARLRFSATGVLRRGISRPDSGRRGVMNFYATSTGEMC